jgi:hypothetical protein
VLLKPGILAGCDTERTVVMVFLGDDLGQALDVGPQRSNYSLDKKKAVSGESEKAVADEILGSD